MKSITKALFLHNRLFYCLGSIACLCIVGFFVPLFFIVAKVALLIVVVLTLVDCLLLFATAQGIIATRILPERLSNGDDNKISLHLTNQYAFKTYNTLIEELPYQFQKHDFIFTKAIDAKESSTQFYMVRPTQRGVYEFGHLNIYVSSAFRLAIRKYSLAEPKELKCYPSFLQLNSLTNKALVRSSSIVGTKKYRRIGHSLEFEQIKEYVSGDDIRTLNWKATAKANQLMVNQFIEEKAQTVYAIIDKGRVMQLAFNQLSLLDYAINATLALSNAVLRKHDKAGMLTFSKKIEDVIVAEQRNSQMSLISEALYNSKTDFSESDFSKLYATIKRKITQRSLLILFTNFETRDALQRQLPYLRALSKNHLLIVVFFENTELEMLTQQKAKNIRAVYDKVIAEKFMYEKHQIVNELKKYGIQAVLTKPELLTSDTISKYLELKSRGLF